MNSLFNTALISAYLERGRDDRVTFKVFTISFWDMIFQIWVGRQHMMIYYSQCFRVKIESQSFASISYFLLPKSDFTWCPLISNFSELLQSHLFLTLLSYKPWRIMCIAQLTPSEYTHYPSQNTELCQLSFPHQSLPFIPPPITSPFSFPNITIILTSNNIEQLCVIFNINLFIQVAVCHSFNGSIVFTYW